MEPLYFIMAIMGCGDAGDACQQARTMPVRYPSAIACRAAIADQLGRNTDLSFPVITAACQPSSMLMARAEPSRNGG